MSQAPRTIGIIGFEGVMALDLAAPLEVFATANDLSGETQPLYRLVVAGVQAGPFRSETGLQMAADVAMDEAPELDTLIVPGGRGLRLGSAEPLVDWLRARAPHTRRVASVC